MPLPTACPLCNKGREHQNVVTPHVYSGRDNQAFFQCMSCDVIYLFPPLNLEEQSEFYAKEFENFMENRSNGVIWKTPETHVTENAYQFTRRLKYLNDYLPKPGGRILEVGCSSGFMLIPLQKKGFECIGIEPSGAFSEFLTSNDILSFKSKEEFATSDEAKDHFDLIMHFFVLEHISTPEEFIAEQLILLKPGGKLIIEIPNAADALSTIYNIPAFERFYWSVAHNWYFTKKSFAYVLEQTEQPYEILLDQRYDLSNHFQWALDGRPGGAKRFTPKLGLEIEEQYKMALIKAEKCDTLIGVINKPMEQ